MKLPLRLLAPMLAGYLPLSTLHAGLFTDNFDSGTVPAGATVFGTAVVETTAGFTGGALKLTKNTGGQQGSIVIDDLDGGATVNSFTAIFKARVDGGLGTPADGWSFCVGSDLPGASWGEEGAGTGLSISFDIYVNGDLGETSPALTLRWGGTQIAELLLPLASLTTGEGTPPTPTWADVMIKLETDGSLDVSFDGVAYFTDFFMPYIPIAGAKFGFGGRTGGAVSNHFIDDLSITTTTGSLKAGIVHQPQSSIFLSGSPARFYVLLGNEAAALAYQWERRAPGGGAFVAVPGATTRDLVTAAVTPADNGATYRLAITDAAGTTLSDEATLTVDTLPEPVFPYSQDFAGGAILPGSTAYPTAAGDVGGFLSLTAAANDQAGGFVVDDLNAGAAISSIFATFDLHMGETTTVTPDPPLPLPADGFSFNWGQGMIAGTVAGAEDGAGNGLRVCFDVYDNTDGNPYNGTGEGPTLDLKWGTTVLSSVRVSPYEFDTGTAFVHVAVSLSTTGQVSVAFNGRLYFKNVQVPAWTALAGGQFGFYARTGGANQKHEIDNLKIKTEVYAGLVDITDEPDDFIGIVGGTATYTVGANYAVPPATVKWQKKAPADPAFTDIPLATSPTLITNSLTSANNGTLYRAIVSLTPTNFDTSREALLTMVDFTAPGNADVVLNFEGALTNTGTAAGVVPVLTGNAALVATGGIGDSGYLSITENQGSQSGALIVENFSGASGQGALLATFYVHLTGGGVVPGNPADGFSFNWGSDVPNTTVGGFGAEEGAGTGLIVTFDTYDNGGGEAPAMGIKYGGVYITPEVKVTRATLQPLDWAQVGIRVENDGTVDLMFNGAVILHNVPIPGWTGLANGRFNISARTGGASETHWVDSVVLNTTNYVGPITFTQQPVNTAGFVGSTVTFTAQVNDPGQTTWQWESAPAGSLVFAPIPSATANSYTTPVLGLADADRRFRVKAQGLSPANLLTSTFAILSVENPILPPASATLTFDEPPQNPSPLTYAFLGSGIEDDASGGGVGGSGFASLTTAVDSLMGNLVIDDFNSGAPVASMYASFQVRLGGHDGAVPADGMAFVWGNDVGLTTPFGEEGGGNGLIVALDTYNNGAPDFIGLTLKWQGNAVAERPIPTADLLSDPDYYPMVVKVDADGTGDVWFNNKIIFNNIPLPGFSPVSGANFVWGARTGGENENAFIDDIRLFTATAGAAGTINIQVVGANIVITYTGTLQSSPTMATGSWTNVVGATSPYQFPKPTSGIMFFRASQ